MEERESDRSARQAQPASDKVGVTRRQFVQSTALLGTISVSGGEIIPSASVQAHDAADFKIAQESPRPAARAPVMPVRPEALAPTAPPVDVREFVRLSQVLTGIDELDQDLAAQYLQRCSDNPEVSGQLPTIVQTLSQLKGSRDEIENGLRSKLEAAGVDSPIFAASEQIIYLWYMGGFFRKKVGSTTVRYWDYGPPDHYFRGLAWPTIGVKPPMSAHNSVYWTTPGSQRG